MRSKYLLRQGIKLSVFQVEDEKVKEQRVWELLEQHRDEKVLVYVENRFYGDRSTEGFSARARERHFLAEHFHGSLDTKRKSAVIDAFKKGDVKTVFATSAFGMGIDIPDIRGVIHFRPPESIEQYYQQLGRVGRDGKEAWATIFYSDKNFAYQKREFIDKGLPTSDSLTKAFANMFAGEGKVKALNYYDDEETQANYHYLLRSQAFAVLCKGASLLKNLEKSRGIVLPEFDRFLGATKRGVLIAIANKLETTPCALMRDIYAWLLATKIRYSGPPDKALIVEALVEELPAEVIDEALVDALRIKEFKYEQLDKLKALLDGYTDSKELHQEIGRHLGLSAFHLGRVHETQSRDWVRSKSEVIIANILFGRQVPFEYEKPLTAGGKTYSPDFTIHVGGRAWYWEHLGMLGNPDYKADWDVKRTWYQRYFPGQLITTVESQTLSMDTESQVDRLLAKLHSS